MLGGYQTRIRQTQDLGLENRSKRRRYQWIGNSKLLNPKRRGKRRIGLGAFSPECFLPTSSQTQCIAIEKRCPMIHQPNRTFQVQILKPYSVQAKTRSPGGALRLRRKVSVPIGEHPPKLNSLSPIHVSREISRLSVKISPPFCFFTLKEQC